MMDMAHWKTVSVPVVLSALSALSTSQHDRCSGGGDSKEPYERERAHEELPEPLCNSIGFFIDIMVLSTSAVVNVSHKAELLHVVQDFVCIPCSNQTLRDLSLSACCMSEVHTAIPHACCMTVCTSCANVIVYNVIISQSVAHRWSIARSPWAPIDGTRYSVHLCTCASS